LANQIEGKNRKILCHTRKTFQFSVIFQIQQSFITHFSEILSYKITQNSYNSEILSLKTPLLARFWPWQRI